jgi:hypothetical protein
MIKIDDQPISSTFFGEGKWLTEFITPSNLEVQNAYSDIAGGLSDIESRIVACHDWVASMAYKENLVGKLWIEGKSSVQHDLWCEPSTIIRIKVGNCANKAFLLASLLRNTLGSDQIWCVLGNLLNRNGKGSGGHAWVQVRLNGRDFIVEATQPKMPALAPAELAGRYEEVHLFNDKETFAIPGRTVMTPFKACYSDWLHDYLDHNYIQGLK